MQAVRIAARSNVSVPELGGLLIGPGQGAVVLVSPLLFKKLADRYPGVITKVDDVEVDRLGRGSYEVYIEDAWRGRSPSDKSLAGKGKAQTKG